MKPLHLNILYIEDNYPDFKLLERKIKNIKEYSFQLTHAVSLKEGINKIKEQAPELLLLDLSLPDAFGLEGLEFMKRQYPKIPVVVLTGNTDKGVGLKAIKNGAQDYLVKGDFSVELFSRVCNYAIQRFQINAELKKALNDVENLNTELNVTLEALREEKRIVEQKNKQINAFISLLANDLKHPVSAVSTLVHHLLESDIPLEKQKEYLSQIQRSSDSMLNHILSIIETSEVQKGRLNLTLIADTPYYTLNAAIDKFILEAIRKNVIINIMYKKDLPVVSFDKKFLHNILTTLIDYILKQLEGNTRINIKTVEEHDRLRVILEVGGFTLTDNEKLDFLGDYQPAYQTSDEQVMTGYQLGLIKQQLKAMKGTLGIESTPSGRGTVFWFTLALAGESIV